MKFFTPPTNPVPPAPVGVPIPYPNTSRRPQSGNQILFFDEADSLFAKRG